MNAAIKPLVEHAGQMVETFTEHGSVTRTQLTELKRLQKQAAIACELKTLPDELARKIGEQIVETFRLEPHPDYPQEGDGRRFLLGGGAGTKTLAGVARAARRIIEGE